MEEMRMIKFLRRLFIILRVFGVMAINLSLRMHWNHRVLIWNQMPVSYAQPADIVLGQKNFSQNQPNLNGIQATPTERSMHWPYGVFQMENPFG